MEEYFTEASFKRAKRTVVGDVIYLTCPDCGGDGEQYTSHRYNCYSCDGRGILTIEKFKEEIKKASDRTELREIRRAIESKLSYRSKEELDQILGFIRRMELVKSLTDPLPEKLEVKKK